MFLVGDKVMYGSMGVCTVLAVEVPDIPGSRESYVLKPLYVANAKVYAPVENNPVILRSLSTPEEVQLLIDSLPKLEEYPPVKERQEAHNTYRMAIKSADSAKLAKLLKTLYGKKQRIVGQRKIVPSAEREYFEMAEKVLHGEIATVLQMPIGEVSGYIAERLKSDSGISRAVAS